MSLLGLVRHMAQVEHNWFSRTAQGSEETRLYTRSDDRDHEFTAVEPTKACVEEAFATWKRQITAAQAWLEDLPEPQLGDEVPIAGREERVSFRDLLVHMIEEYARHCGHADLLRECIDGRTGQ